MSWKSRISAAFRLNSNNALQAPRTSVWSTCGHSARPAPCGRRRGSVPRTVAAAKEASSKYDRFGSFAHIIPRFFWFCKGCRGKKPRRLKKIRTPSPRDHLPRLSVLGILPDGGGFKEKIEDIKINIYLGFFFSFLLIIFCNNGINIIVVIIAESRTHS